MPNFRNVLVEASLRLSIDTMTKSSTINVASFF